MIVVGLQQSGLVLADVAVAALLISCAWRVRLARRAPGAGLCRPRRHTPAIGRLVPADPTDFDRIA